MEQANIRTNSRSVVTAEPMWYRIYYHALLEGDRDKAKVKIDRARKAIQERIRDLHSLAPSNAREPQDLRNAQTYLGILSQHIGSDSENVLWD